MLWGLSEFLVGAGSLCSLFLRCGDEDNVKGRAGGGCTRRGERRGVLTGWNGESGRVEDGFGLDWYGATVGNWVMDELQLPPKSQSLVG